MPKIIFNTKIMPENTENVPIGNPNFFIVNVSGERFFSFAPKVLRIGHTVSVAETKYSVFQRKELEFCFRLASDEEFAEDDIDNQIYRSEFPHLLIKYPGTVHRYRTRCPRTAYFIIYPAETAKIFELSDVDLSQFSYPFEITPQIAGLIDELRSCESQIHEPGIPDRIDLIALRLISEVILQSRKTSQIQPAHKKIHQIAVFMEGHLNEKLDCRILAEKWGMSLRTFFRHWKEVYRQSPAQYLLKCRMELAKHLLSRSSLSIEQTAESSGFSSTGYFIQAFKRYYGTTPSGFRRKNMQIFEDK